MNDGSAGAAQRIHFHKMNGLGNEIVVVDSRTAKINLSSAIARAMASAPRSHFDQMMVLQPPRNSSADAYVTIFNADGTESAACGNGTRCIGWLESQKTGRTNVRFETKAGLLNVKVASIDSITVDMGEPTFCLERDPARRTFP